MVKIFTEEELNNKVVYNKKIPIRKQSTATYLDRFRIDFIFGDYIIKS
jgi:hypothetical protein